MKEIQAIAVVAVLTALVLPLSAQAEIEEIVVTAQKRSESLQDVPIAITAFTGDTMKNLGIDDATDLVVLTPGLSERKQGGSYTSYFLRGVGTNDIHLTAAPAIGQYFDEVTLTSGFQSAVSLFDMERVEVLKGPQNTLFGLNTTGGTVSYFSNKPEVGGGTQGSLDVRAGNLSLMNVEGALGFDLGDTAAGRLSGVWKESGGAFDSVGNGNDFGDNDTQALRGQLLWEPTERTNVLLNLHWAQSENHGTAYKSLGTRSPDGSGAVCAEYHPQSVPNFDRNTSCITVPPPAVGDLGPGQTGANPSFSDWRDVGMDIGREEVETQGLFLKLNHDFDWATFTSITAFDNLQFENTNDLDGSQLGLMAINQEDDRDTFQQELRLVSAGDGAFRWIAGAYYLDESSDSFTGLRSNLIGGWALLPNVQLDHSKENLGLYGQGEYDLGENFTLTVGLRWSDETIEGDYLPSRPRVVGLPNATTFDASTVNALVAAQNTGAPGFDANGFEIARQVSQRLTNTDTGFTAKLDYQFGEDALVYLSFSRGFKGSALDIRAAYALVPVANVVTGLEESRLNPESLDAWELGFKSTFFERRLQVDAAVFQYYYDDLQQFITVRGIPTLDNAPESEVFGFDGNVRFDAGSGFYGQLGVSYLDSEVTDASGSAFVEGGPLASSPEWSFTALAAYDIQLGNNVLTLMTNLSYTDEQASDTLTGAVAPVEGSFIVDAYTLLNASVTYRFGDAQNYKVAVYGNNLTDEQFCHGIRASDNANLADPGNAGRHHGNVTCAVSNASVRTYGVSFGLEF